MEDDKVQIDWSSLVKEEDRVQIDWSSLVKEEVKEADLFNNIQNDKINREFLSNHVDDVIVLWGSFDRKIGKNALMQKCGFSENGVNIYLGHMKWTDFFLHAPNEKKYVYDEHIRILGKVYTYSNSDPSYNLDNTYGVKVIKIL